jgi:hypothetical protein
MACTSKKLTGCSGFSPDGQAFPTSGRLYENLDLEKAELITRLSKAQPEVRIYSYVMTSVKQDGDTSPLRQKGNGPNFQGGCITLCACKHKMRTYLAAEDWKDKWIAGFTSVECGERHWLFYLAQVKHAYASHCELWHALPKVRTAKSAMQSRLGDLFVPTGCIAGSAKPPCDDCSCKFALNHYHTPPVGHVHRGDASDRAWKIDIDYALKKTLKRKPKRPASLLVGDPKFSFLWQKPTIYIEEHWREKQWDGLDAFLDALKEKAR